MARQQAMWLFAVLTDFAALSRFNWNFFYCGKNDDKSGNKNIPTIPSLPVHQRPTNYDINSHSYRLTTSYRLASSILIPHYFMTLIVLHLPLSLTTGLSLLPSLPPALPPPSFPPHAIFGEIFLVARPPNLFSRLFSQLSPR